MLTGAPNGNDIYAANRDLHGCARGMQVVGVFAAQVGVERSRMFDLCAGLGLQILLPNGAQFSLASA